MNSLTVNYSCYISCIFQFYAYLCGVFITVAFVATFKDLKKNKTQLTTIIPPIIHQVVCLAVSLFVCMHVCPSAIVYLPQRSVSLAVYVV